MTITTQASGTCKSNSGKTTITYDRGLDTNQQPHFRIAKTSGGGFFSREWVAWADIEPVLKKLDTITSRPLQKLFKGKSVNTPGFLLAVLHKEGLVEPHEGKQRHFTLADPAPFLARCQQPAQAQSAIGKKAPARKRPATKAKAKPANKKAPAKKAR